MSTKLGDITLTKQTGTVLTLSTGGTYVATDVSFDLGVQSGHGTVTVASTDAEIQSDSSTKNISSIFGTKSTTVPLSGYYLKIGASGTGGSTVTIPGWFDVGSIGSASATTSFYFPVDSATGTITGTNTITPSASVAGVNVSLSNTDNGISITSTGGGLASAYVTALGNHPGYVPSNGLLATDIITSSISTTTATTYISGVTLLAPVSGTRSFSITLPNGSDTITLTFTVDATGSWSVE